ncbi:aldehyde dehydrogenase family protein [Aquabacter spiritensis]|uniref:2-hydroxymuconate semialdehyde dehydrogenase n=1 Tax=Aquabacter spiritensis TaxID=933073 RepID=A0A4R3M336_9HYPH|nr:aldehyde dehydrogenase family protein [Aquabacter spiritensis]TCT05687.1 2-hydroxymuconate semialdehyde dehydrogenase [Aquabacter spiritensis]
MSPSVSGTRDAVPCFIDGRDVPIAAAFDKHDPATGRPNARVAEADAALVDAAVETARRALRGPWGKTTLDARIAFLERLAAHMEANLAALVAAEIADTGKPITPTTKVEIPRAIANFRAFAQIARDAPAETFETALPGGARARNTVLRHPVGVVGIVAPWNLPLLLLTWKVAPALVCGNAVVVKPSEHSPRTALLLARMAHACGLPDGVLNVVHGHGAGAAGGFLVAHPGVDAITFTGETRTGEAIMRAAAAGPRPVSLELGGKNPALIFADCDLKAAIAGTARSLFDNCGQVCLTTERVFVARPVFAQVAAGLAAAALALKPGDPHAPETTLGPAISALQRDKVLGLYAQAKADGAEVLAGGGALEMSEPFAEGYWVAPTLWAGLPDDAEICRREVFGPCAHLSVFDTEDEVLARANASEFGLAATVWSTDSARVQRVAAGLQSGTVWANCWRVRDERAPFGGFKRSGVGREGGVRSLDFYSELKTLCVFEPAA